MESLAKSVVMPLPKHPGPGKYLIRILDDHSIYTENTLYTVYIDQWPMECSAAFEAI